MQFKCAMCLFTLFFTAAMAGHTKVKLSEVQTLILRDGEMTTGRRSSPVPQLSCHGEYCSVRPSEVVCRNIGSSGKDPSWKCDADMELLKFGYDLDIQCEGYEYPDDPYVLEGSCGLSYSLKLKHPPSSIPLSKPAYNNAKDPDNDIIGMISMLLILALILSSCSGPSPSYSSSYRSSSYDSSPGFWTGAATGYMAASSRNSSWGSSYGGSSGSSWGGSSRSSGFARTSRR